MQLDLFHKPPEWEPPRVADLPDLRGAKLIGLDTETKDPGLMDLGPGFIRGDAHVIGFSIAVDGFSCYIPLRHYSQNVDDGDQAIAWLRDILRGPDKLVLGANIHYDLDALVPESVHVDGTLYDVQVVDAIIDETQRSFSLENIAQRRLDEGKRSQELVAVLKAHNLTMSDLDKLEGGYVQEYADRDASLLLDIYESQQEDIGRYQLTKAVDMETKLTRVLWDMHQKGVPVNVSRVEQLNEQWKAEETRALDTARRIAGWRFNPNSPKSTGAMLRNLGITPNVTAAGNDSVTNEFLEAHTREPAVEALLRYRRINKTRRDFCEGVFLKYLHRGRVYPQWFQSRNSKKNEELATGASTGRITGSKPNLTQIPVRTDIGKRLREAVVPEDGEIYCKLDYSSQEPRIGLHFAFVAQCPGAAAARERYLTDKETDYHEMTRQMIEDGAGIDIGRRDAKTMNLGLTYGMQINSLSGRLGVSIEQAKQLLKAYHAGVPYVGKITQLAKRRAEDAGCIRTIMGRLRHFNKWESTSYGDPGLFDNRDDCIAKYGSARLAGTHKAFNSAVQGSAADQMKMALITVHEEGMLPLLQVYDELGMSVSSEAEGHRVAEIMEHVVDEKLGLTVPSLVEPSFAKNWGEA